MLKVSLLGKYRVGVQRSGLYPEDKFIPPVTICFSTPLPSHPEVWILENSQPFNIGGEGWGTGSGLHLPWLTATPSPALRWGLGC